MAKMTYLNEPPIWRSALRRIADIAACVAFAATVVAFFVIGSLALG